MSYPGNPNMPAIEDLDTIAGEYVRAVAAGASIVHHHGIHYLEHEMQADGRRLSRIDFDGWKLLTEKIRDACDPIVQFGIASARLEEKFRLMELRPEMMSYAFNVHDEYFRPDPAFPANEMYALHPRDELEEFCRGALEHGVKTEVTERPPRPVVVVDVEADVVDVVGFPAMAEYNPVLEDANFKVFGESPEM